MQTLHQPRRTPPAHSRLHVHAGVALTCALFVGPTTPAAEAAEPALVVARASEPPNATPTARPAALLGRRLWVEPRLAGAGHPWQQAGAADGVDPRLMNWMDALDGRFHLLAMQLRADTLSMEQMRRDERHLEQWHGVVRYVGPAFDAAADLLVLWDRVDEDDEPSRATLRWTPRLLGAGATLKVRF